MSKAFCRKVAPALCTDPANSGKIIEDFSNVVDNLIYQWVRQHRESALGQTGPDVVPYIYFQVTARAMATAGHISPDQVPKVEQRAAELLALPILETPTFENVRNWLEKSRVQKGALSAPAAPTWAPEDLAKAASQHLESARPPAGPEYWFNFGDGRRSRPVGVQRIPSGLPAFDAITGGFGYRELALGIAPTGAGKTVMACQLAATFAGDGHPGMLITSATPQEDLRRRIYSNVCDIPFDEIKDGVNMEELPSDKRDAILALNARLNGKLDILDWNASQPKSIEQDLENEIRKFQARLNVRPHWLIFDWIGRAALGHVSYADLDVIRHIYKSAADKLADIARSHNIVCIAFAQTNERSRNKERVDCSLLSECKTMGNGATIIFGISGLQEKGMKRDASDNMRYLDEQYLSIVKPSHGARGFPIARQFAFQRFETWERKSVGAPPK